MAKIPIKHLVSLIIEQINTKGELNRLFPPDKDVYIDDLSKYPILFEPVQDAEDATPEQGQEPQSNIDLDRSKIRTLEPEVEPELAMVAEGKPPKFPRHTIPEVIRIPAEELYVAEGSNPPGRVVCEDPETGEMVEGVVISNVIMTLPSGKEVLVFRNHGEPSKVDKPVVNTRYVVLKESRDIINRYMKFLPRGDMWQNPIDRDVLETLLANPPGPDATPEEQEAYDKKVSTLQNARAKRYALYPLINRMFSDHELLDKLDISLIPETWATPIRTEHTTNVSESQVKSFGGTSAEIDADFYSVRDMTDVQMAIDNVMDLRADLALGALEDDEREREVSTAVPRRHANMVYRNGNWFAKQRVHDEEFFRREGGKTPRYELLSKNIQEGDKKVTVESVLDVKGQIEGDNYGLISTFTATLSVRHPETDAGVTVGKLFEPIVTRLRKPLVDDKDRPINPETFTLENNIKFFVNEGRIVRDSRTGFLPDFFQLTGENIKNNINPDAVLQTMATLAEDAAQVTDDELNNALPNR